MTIRSTGALFNTAFAFYKAHWKLLVGITLIPGVLQAIVSYLAPAEGQVAPAFVPGALLLVAVIITVAVSIISAAALVLAAADPSRYQSPVDAIKAGSRFFLPMLWVMVLTALALMGGFILFIIPGLIFAVWFAFSYFTLILEGKRGAEAMKASKAYVEGHWWQVAGRIGAVALVMIALSIILDFLLAMLMPTQALHKAASALISSLFSPFMLVYMYSMYQDLKAVPSIEIPKAATIDLPPQEAAA